MELFQDVATIVTFVAPGYFVIKFYSIIHARRDRDFSQLLVESIVYSLPIVAIVTALWQLTTGHPPESMSVGYVAALIGVAIVAGTVAALLRVRWPIKHIANILNMGEPNSDFVQAQLQRIDNTKPATSAVTIQLKSGSVFSGTIDAMSRYSHDGQPMYFSLTNIAWYNQASGKWDERRGNIIVSRDEIEYIETGKLADI